MSQQILYKEYFTIDEKYKPVMTRDEFIKEPTKWLEFYPHKSFIDFLRMTLDQMERSQKSVWLTGAYGTGKTYAALVLQKLFNDSDENIDEWFTKRKKQFTGDTIKQSLKKLRKNGVFAVFETGSDAVGAKEQFLVRIEQAIVKALHERNLEVPPKGDMELITERIRQEGKNFFDTKNAIQDRLAHLNSSYETFNELARDLNNDNLRDGLLRDCLTVLRERSIYLDLSSLSLLTWINSVLKVNKLSKLVFIWDEFSAYVDKNRSELKTLEELAEAAQQGSFYFIPVTHMTIDAYLASGAESAKKARDRFEFKALDMPNDTAFKLAAEAFQILPAKENDWEQERMQLWHSIRDVIDLHFKDESDIQGESFKEILPIHPMAAYVLKHLSTLVGSNQRSLFDYLKNDAKGSEFRQFIESGGPAVEGKQILTVDYLWSYFVERDDLGQERTMLEIKSEYLRQTANLQPEERRIFKAVLLFSLLGRLQKGAHRLLQPSVANIVQSFIGDGAILGVETIIKQLEGKGCFHVVNGQCEMFRSNINEGELEGKKDLLRPRFYQEVLAIKTKDAMEKKIKELTIVDRFDVRVASVDSISINIQNRERFAPDSGNQILVQFIFAKDEKEKLEIPEKIKSLAKHFHDHRIIFLTLPVTFCENNTQHWEEYIEYLARRELALDATEQQRYKEVTDKWDEGWKRMLLDTGQTIIGYKPCKNSSPETQKLQWATLKQYLFNFVELTLPDCVDSFSGYTVNAFGTPAALKQWAESGISFLPKAAAGQAINAFRRNGIDGDTEWFLQNPQHPLAKIRDLCLKKLENTVGRNVPCSIRKIYIELQRPPYGLRCNPYSAFVLGFVLKDFLSRKPPLQWTNGQLTRLLDQPTLAEIIEAVVKNDGNGNIKDEKLICRLSKEEKAFIDQSPRMFKIAATTDQTVEAVIQASQQQIERISNRVPLWCLAEYIDHIFDPQAEACRTIIENFCTASLISSKNKTEDRNNSIQQIGRILIDTDGLAEAFSKYITPERFADAFLYYIDSKEPALKRLAEEVGDRTLKYSDAIKEKVAETASWLWKEEDYSSTIACVLREYSIIQRLMSLWKNSGFITYKNAVSRLRNVILGGKIPFSIITQAYPSLQVLIDCLKQPQENDISQPLEDIFQTDVKNIEDIFFNPTDSVRINLLAEKLGDISPETLKEIYNNLPDNGAIMDEAAFLQQIRAIVQQHIEKSLASQVKKLWNDKTRTESPSDWAEQNGLPISLLFEDIETAKDVQIVVDSPNTFTAALSKKVSNVNQLKN